MDAVTLSITVVAGLCIGSFLNVVIHRLPLQLHKEWERDSRDFLGLEPPAEDDAPRLTIAFPPSCCPACKRPLRAWHNIPVLSYLFLRGRCAHCSAPISFQYPLVEIVTAVVCLYVVFRFGFSLQGALVLAFSLALIALTGIDLKTQLLPDILTYPLLWLGLLANSQHIFTDLQSAVVGAAAGYLVLWSVYWLFKLLTGKEGMGHGDFKLLAALGAWTGWQMLPLIILLSSFVGALIGVAMILILGRDRQIPIAFGPYLAIAGWIAMMWGSNIVTGYLAMIG